MMDEAKRLETNTLKRELKKKGQEARKDVKRLKPGARKKRNKASKSDSEEEWKLSSDDADDLLAEESKLLNSYEEVVAAVMSDAKRNKKVRKCKGNLCAEVFTTYLLNACIQVLRRALLRNRRVRVIRRRLATMAKIQRLIVMAPTRS
jgi:predicted Zn-dependent protease